MSEALRLPEDDLFVDLPDFDFDLGISDSQVLSATQLLELTMPPNDTVISHVSVVNNSVYSDISDDELVMASASVDNLNTVKNENVAPDFSTEISDTELVAATQLADERSNVRHFKQPVSVDRLAEIQAEQFAKRTVDKALWAVTLFGEWRAQRNVTCLSACGKSMVYLDKPFTLMTDEELAYTVPLFVAEVQKKDGSDYPPATLRDLVLSLQKHLEINGRQVHFLNDDKFRGIRDTLDGLMRERARNGLGLKKRQAEVITEEMEEKLWSLGLLGDKNPRTLLNTIVYVFGLNFALRGRDEHRRLRWAQLTLHTAADGRRYLQYQEDVSKTRGGGLNSFRKPAKVTQAFELPQCRQRCPVRLYEMYTSLCPSDRPDNAFYLRPLDKYTPDRWFANVAVGVQTLGSVVSNVCKAAGFIGFFSNHSLRATAATRLFSANVDEQLIKLKTGHGSDAVRSYKRVSDKQLSEMSDIISAKVPKTATVTAPVDCASAVASVVHMPGFSGILSECQFSGTVNININVQK